MQDGQFCRIGAQADKKVEVRIVCATNRKLEEEIENGNFRQDLYYRINVVNLFMPPLRERRSDIDGLVNYFLEYYNRKYNCRARPLSSELMEVLQKYHWPGNIRELENLIQRLVLMVEAPVITLKHLPQPMLLSKKADVIPGVIPFSFDKELRENSRVLFTQKDVVGRTQMILWAAREDFIKKNRAAMVDFMEDVIRAVRWYLDPANHKEAVEIAARVSKRPAAAFDKWLFTKQGQNGDYYHDPDMKPDLKALQANIFSKE